MYYYTHHIGDFIKETSRLTDHQTLTYLRLIWIYYETEESLSNDFEVLSMKTGSDKETISLILRAFFTESGGKWFQMRCESEIRKYHKKSTSAKNANKARWSNISLNSDKNSDVNSYLNSDSEQNSNHIPTNNQEPITSISNPNGLLVISGAADCPHQEILKIYSEILPELPQPRIWEGQRKKNLSSRWRWVSSDLKKKNMSNGKEECIDFFRRMFEYVSKSDLLMGRVGSWSADLGWMVKADNFAKIIQGNYENKVKA